ncbi:hypothetical protein PF010_g18406 [Phytophthora fragariae]|uniref:Uncharacterized protein n=1 Tax=Phytophthora fragariae TaxID=53985 RepID=A0A6A3JFW4_9STRA|nr:hypothetical protein PF011_g17281 [Phytophthora fragariae]KAE9090903.1 hypothetical protein PF010_g18406 [Phytophthora fragariae]KAE9223696.1 hypothetical protein PF004_g12434 [Phytophthora fragariae]
MTSWWRSVFSFVDGKLPIRPSSSILSMLLAGTAGVLAHTSFGRAGKCPRPEAGGSEMRGRVMLTGAHRTALPTNGIVVDMSKMTVRN